jgi:hypothetical protein
MATKHYRVVQDNFLWKEGAILKHNGSNGYEPIEDIWDSTPSNGSEYISTRIIEHPDNAAFFERVYKDDLAGNVYRTAEKMRTMYKDAFKA